MAYKKGTSKFKLKKSDMQLYSLCAVPMVLVLLFNYLPMGGIIIAFKDYKYSKGILGSKWIGLDNFRFLFKSNDFFRITWNTLELNFIFIVTGIIAAVLVAILMYGVQSRQASKAYQTALITPYFMSWVIVSYIVYAFLNPSYGMLNKLIEGFGGQPIDWYSSPGAWSYILTACSVWKNVGMDSVVYYAALMGIDSALFEAARIDGANRWQIMRRITMPSLIPLITILTILKIGNIFRADFGLFYQVTRNVGTLYSRTDVIDTYVYRAMREIGDMGMSSAAGLIQSLVGFALVMVTNHIAKKIDPESSLF